VVKIPGSTLTNPTTLVDLLWRYRRGVRWSAPRLCLWRLSGVEDECIHAASCAFPYFYRLSVHCRFGPSPYQQTSRSAPPPRRVAYGRPDSTARKRFGRRVLGDAVGRPAGVTLRAQSARDAATVRPALPAGRPVR